MRKREVIFYHVKAAEILVGFPFAMNFCSCESPLKCSFPENCEHKDYATFEESANRPTKKLIKLTIERDGKLFEGITEISEFIKWKEVKDANL